MEMAKDQTQMNFWNFQNGNGCLRRHAGIEAGLLVFPVLSVQLSVHVLRPRCNFSAAGGVCVWGGPHTNHRPLPCRLPHCQTLFWHLRPNPV